MAPPGRPRHSGAPRKIPARQATVPGQLSQSEEGVTGAAPAPPPPLILTLTLDLTHLLTPHSLDLTHSLTPHSLDRLHTCPYTTLDTLHILAHHL